MGDLGPRSFRLRALLILGVASFLMALPALQGDVLFYDDHALLYGDSNEPGALDRDPASFFTGTFYYAYLPVYGLTYRLDAVFGAGRDATFLLHFQNVLWHAAASYLAFCVLGLLLRNRAAALLGALLFAVHPLHVESVAWIASRKDVVSGAFLFLAWICALQREEGWRPGTAAGVAFFLVACFAKASAIVLPALLVVAVLLLPRYAGRRRHAVLDTWPYFAAAVVPLVTHLLVGVERGVVREPRGLSESLAALVMGWGGGIARTLAPLDLSIDYPEARAADALLVPGALLVAAVAALLALRRRAPVAAFGIAAFFAALLPFNNVFPATDVLAADRYLYLPLFGLAAVAAWAAARWRGAYAGVALAGVICLVLSMVGATRFTSDEELWTRTIEARESSALAHINRGLARVQRATASEPHEEQTLRAAVDDLRRGLHRAALKEHVAKASLGLGLPLLELGEVAEAHERVSKAIETVSETHTADARRFRAEALYHRAVVSKLGLGDLRSAARDFEASAKLWARYEAWAEAGAAHLRTGDLASAKDALRKAAGIAPERPEPMVDLARLYRSAGDREAEWRALEDAAERAPRHPEVVQARALYWLDRESPDHVRARRELEHLPEKSALRARITAAVEAYTALYHFRRGDLDQALRAADRATAQKGVRGSFLYELGHVYLEAGRYDDAVRCYRRSTDVLAPERVRRNAIARAHALRAYGLLESDEDAACVAMRAALDARPDLIEAGAAPLRGEIEELRAARRPGVLLLAAAVVAGDAPAAEARAVRLLEGDLEPVDRMLIHRLRSLVRAFSARDLKGAVEDLQQVLARREDDLWARYRLAQVATLEAALSGGEAREASLKHAIDLLTAIMAEEPSFHLARLARGEARFALDDISGAKLDYEALRREGFERKEVFLKEAILHRLVFVKGGEPSNLAKADDLLRKALAIDPNFFDALFELGNVQHLVYDHGGDAERVVAFTEALKWYRRAMALNPRSRAPRHEWARLCLKAAARAIGRQRITEAHDLVRRLEREAKDIVEVHEQRVELNLRPDFVQRTGLSPDEAFLGASKALAEIERLAPDDPDLPRLRSLYHRTRGTSFYFTWMKLKTAKQEERAEVARKLAAEEFRRACFAWPLDPDNAVVRRRLREIAPGMIEVDREAAKRAFERGAAAFREERYPEAAAAFHEAVLLFPESTELRYNWALALTRAGRADLARPELERVANAPDGTDFPEASFLLGRHYLESGSAMDRRIARTWLERYVRTMEEAGRGDEPRVARAEELVRELKSQ